MKTIALIVAALVSCAAFAQTSTVTPREDRGYQPMRGTSNVGRPVATEAQCEDAIKADVLARKATSLYKCRHETVKLGAYSAAPAPVVCPAPPAPTVATVACASPLVGSWQQTTTVAIGPAPTCTRTATLTPNAAPAGACTQPPTTTGTVLYFSSCRAGSAATCVPGTNSNPGTQAQPKFDLAGVNVNALPPGSRLLFARGGVWEGFGVQLANRNVTSAAPLVFEAYGAGTIPVLRSNGSFAFLFGPYGDTQSDGGYVVRNLKLDGQTGQGYGVHLRYDVRDVLLDGVEVSGYEIGIHSQNTGANGNERITIRNSRIYRNSGMGLLGDAYGFVLEGNTFEQNNFSGSTFNHAVYISGKGTGLVIRGNTFANNSVAPSGVCTGGNVTVHGQWVGGLIENNTIRQDVPAGFGCYGLSVTPGYNSAEWFRDFEVRGNRVINLGGCSLCFGATRAPYVHDNVVISDQPAGEFHTAILTGANAVQGAGGDDPDGGGRFENNVVCFRNPGTKAALNVAAGGGATVSGTIVRTGDSASTGPCAR